MTEKKKATAPVWDVDEPPVGEIDIKLIFSRHDEVLTLHHIFREPTAADKQMHRRKLSETKINKQQRNIIHTDYAGANELLWSRCIKQVTGYSVDNTSPGKWKDKIPAEHKIAAVEKLTQWSGVELDEEDSKN